MNAVRPARVVLLGMMGSGKTTVGQTISARTGWPALDNDVLLRELTGGEDTETYSRHGPRALHDLEAEVVRRLLERPPPFVAGAAGATVEYDDVRRRLPVEAFAVYLRARVETLLSRVGQGEGRPWLKPDPRTAMERLFVGREPLYKQSASLVIDVDDLTPDEIAERILDELTAAAAQPG